MKKTLSLALLAACLGVASASAYSHDEGLRTGLYVNAGGAYTIPGSVSISAPGISGASVSLKNGYDVSAAVGYRIMLDEIYRMRTEQPLALRFEVEGGYGENDFSVSGTGIGSANGTLKNYRVMTNVFLDVPITDVIYISLGGGMGWIHSKFSASATMGGISGSGSASDNAFAYQGGISLGILLSDYCTLNLNYRALSYTNMSVGAATLEAPLISMLGASITFQF